MRRRSARSAAHSAGTPAAAMAMSKEHRRICCMLTLWPCNTCGTAIRTAPVAQRNHADVNSMQSNMYQPTNSTLGGAKRDILLTIQIRVEMCIAETVHTSSTRSAGKGYDIA